jgi:hypothetical protein
MLSGRLPHRGVLASILAGSLVIGAPLAAGDDQVVISEILYNPLGDSSTATLEFVELLNLGPGDVDLGGWSLSEGITLTIGEGVVLPAKGRLVLSPDPARAIAHYGLPPAVVLGPYLGRLDNNGEILAVSNRRGEVVNRLRFDDEGPWPTLADGMGPSIEFTASHGKNDLHFLWAASRDLGGTPGRPPRPEGGAVIEGLVNECRPGVSAEDPGFVELFNPLPQAVDLSNFFLISTSGLNARIAPGTVLPTGALLSLDESALLSALPAEDQTVVLLEPDGAALVDAVVLEPAGIGNSIGRFPDGSGRTFVMVTPTPGEPNRYELESPVVINEIHFHPPFVPPAGACERRCSDDHQWLELWNCSSEVVDLTGWQLSRGVDFEFAPGTTLPPGGALVVAASVTAFRAEFGDLPNLVGDWSGRLSHASDRVNLRDPLGNRVDSVRYGDGKPVNDLSPEDGVDDRTFRGSSWPLEADGSGRTLELLHPGLENDLGLSWRASGAAGGSPGAQSSVFTTTPLPVIGNVRHEPAVPRSTEAVAVTCAVSTLHAVSLAEVEWSVQGGGAGTAALRDDGLSDDGRAGDGVWGAAIPPQADGAVVSFRIRVRDDGGRETRVPVQPAVLPYSGFQGNYYLYEVDNTEPPANGNTVYRIIMRQRDLDEIGNRPLESDVLLPATLIAGGSVRHVVGVRYRGENSRRLPNRSYRVDLTPEDPLEEIEHLNLNAGNDGLGDSGVREIISANLFRRAGTPYPQTWPIVLHFPGEVTRDFDTRYIRKEHYGDEFLGRFFGGSDYGNFYRPRDPDGPGGSTGNLAYLGESPDPYRPLYPKRNNEEEDDWTDLIALCRAFDPVATPAAVFADTIEALIDAREWARFFATMGLVGNTDGGIWNNNGEDYFLYHVPADSPRPDAGKWLLLPWDLEEAFSDSNEVLFRPTVPAIARFLRHPRFAPLYYEELRTLTRGVFSRSSMRREFEFIDGIFPPADVFDVVDPLDSFVARRNGFIDQTAPSGITVGGATSASGDLAIAEGDVWKFFRGRSNPPGASMEWTTLPYNDDAWEEGPTGIGFGDGDDATVLGDMQGPGGYSTVFARKEFQVADPGAVTTLVLSMDYDDGFVAFLNGAEVARSLAPGSPGGAINFSAQATGSHEAGSFEPFDLAGHIPRLVVGTNLLAVVGLNAAGGFGGDFSLIPALSVSTGGGGPALSAGCSDLIYATGDVARLSGVVDAALGASVTAGGVLADTSYVTSGPGPYGLAWSAAIALDPGDNAVVIETHAAADGSGPATSSRHVVIRRASGFTEVSGTLAGNTAWTAAQSPYRLSGTLEVPAAVTLSIEAGTTVLVRGGGGINVRGTLLAAGTPESPVHFSAFDCGERWSGIVFQSTGTQGTSPLHTLRGCVFQHAESFQNAPGFITVTSSRLLIDASTLQGIDANAIDGTNCELEVRSTLIEEILEGIHCNTSTTAVIDSTLRNMRGDADAIDFDGSGPERSLVARCTIERSTDDGLDLGACTVDINENVFRGVEDKAISIEGNGAQGGSTLTWNLIHDSGTAMALKNGLTVTEGHHNTVTRCQEGIDLYAKDNAPDGGHADLHSLIVWENCVDLRLDARSSLSVRFSDIGGGGVWPGAGNISDTPYFVDSASDFSLRAESPCIGTGESGSDMGAIPFGGEVAPVFLRGDANEDGLVDIADAFSTLLYLYMERPGPACLDRLDADDSGILDLGDALYSLNFQFASGLQIREPYPLPGQDPTTDLIVCERS